MSVPHALLALLSEGPKYGLQLRAEFEARTGEVWPLNVGQVYTTLQRLERDGLVEADGAGEDSQQKVFRITAAGEAELESCTWSSLCSSGLASRKAVPRTTSAWPWPWTPSCSGSIRSSGGWTRPKPGFAGTR